MATLSAPGIGSGLDINGIIDSLMAVEQIPLQRLQVKAGDYLAQISAYGQLRSDMANFQDATSALGSFNDFDAFSAQSGNTSVFTATANNDVALGSYDIQVESLAASQKQGSGPLGEADPVGTSGDKMTIGIGDETFTVEIGGKTLSEIQLAIKEATDNVGVSASVIRESESSVNLLLSSKNTGLANTMTFSFTNSDDDAIADPLGFTQIQPAADAKIIIDDSYTVIRSSNSISDAIQGVTIDLQSTSATNVSLNITRDSEEIITSVETFVESYNELLSSMSKLKEGDLSGDGTLRMVETQVRSVLGSNASVTGAYSYASDIGISFQKDGTLTFDRNKLTDAMQDDLSSVAELFANDDQGFAFRLDAKLKGMLGDDGLIDAREEGLNASVDNNNKEIADMQHRLELVGARYRSQFSALDVLLGELQATSSYVTAQLSALENLMPGNTK